MTLVQKRSNSSHNSTTNLPDWSALIPVLPESGPAASQLYVAIRSLVEEGTISSGTKLPTTRDLARRLKMSRASAVTAFEMLNAEGFTEARVGSGTFVASLVPRLGPKPSRTAPRASEPQPVPVCALGVADQDHRTLKIFRRLMSRHLARPTEQHFQYGDPRGGAALRTSIARYLKAARGVRCDPDQIILTSGTQQALDFILRAAISPGQHVWAEDPCYPMAKEAIIGSGAHIVGVPVDHEGLDSALGDQLCPTARAVYITPSHQFPLGVTMSMRRRLALIEWANANDAWIIEDDYDSEFRYAGPPLAALQGMDSSGRVAYIGTFSKVLFPGLRMAYAVLPEPLLDRVLVLRSRSDRQPYTLAEGALADLLDQNHFSIHLRRARRRAQASRDILVQSLVLASDGALEVTAPEQGLHLVVRIKSTLADTEIISAAKQLGVGGRALSPMYLSAPAQQGLVLGFSGFTREKLESAALVLDTILSRART